jgi:hypothetical protein
MGVFSDMIVDKELKLQSSPLYGEGANVLLDCWVKEACVTFDVDGYLQEVD